jgi:hypothetical protein
MLFHLPRPQGNIERREFSGTLLPDNPDKFIDGYIIGQFGLKPLHPCQEVVMMSAEPKIRDANTGDDYPVLNENKFSSGQLSECAEVAGLGCRFAIRGYHNSLIIHDHDDGGSRSQADRTQQNGSDENWFEFEYQMIHFNNSVML